jgi:two-component system response regulator AtoC
LRSVKVLVVDDEKNIREAVERYLRLEGLETASAENGLSAQRLLAEEAFAAAVIDLRMPGMDGLALLQWLREQGLRVPVIMISAYGEIRDAVEAMKLGARDYVVKPFDPEELVVRLKRVLESCRLETEVELAAAPEGLEVLGESPGMLDIRAMVEKVAGTPSTVLITGESGTGKEVIARLIHALSGRADSPFVAVNVGGIPETLLESELFGYEKGAFTGADRRKPGMFELASGGTLFLDEIGEMPLHLQVKLLRVLADRRVQRLGGTLPIPVDARLIAATNRDLDALVAEGRFREDLYYRLNVIRLEVPPLREHPGDLAPLIGRLVRRLNARLGKSIRGVDARALEALRGYPFPGNVRELENLLERAMIFAESDTLGPADLTLPAGFAAARTPGKARTLGSTPGFAPLKAGFAPRTLDSLEREAILNALQRWEGSRTRTAAELGISRRTLLNKIKEYGIKP